MPRVELPGDNWVDLKDPYEVTERERQPLKAGHVKLGMKMRASAPAPGSVAVMSPHPILGTPPAPPTASDDEIQDQLDAMEEFERLATAFFIEKWSFATEPGAEALLDLPAHIYSAIDKATTPLFEVLFPPAGGPTTP